MEVLRLKHKYSLKMLTFAMLLVLSLSLIPAVKAQGVWVVKAAYPVGILPTPGAVGIEGLATVMVGGLVYAIGGWDGTVDVSTTVAYNPAANAWSGALLPMPTARAELAAVYDPGTGFIFAIGGRPDPVTGLVTGIVEDYIPAPGWPPGPGVWGPRPAMPTPRKHLGVALVGGLIYAIGGSTGVYGQGPVLGTVEVFNPVANVWAGPLAPMPTARAGFGIAVVGGLIYCIGGYTAPGVFTNVVEAYNPVANAWVVGLAPMPTTRGELVSEVANGHYIQAIGGYTLAAPWTVTNANEEYDTVNNVWAVDAPMPTARAQLAAAGDTIRIYAIGGTVGPGAANFAANEEFTIPMEKIPEFSLALPIISSIGTIVYLIVKRKTKTH